MLFAVGWELHSKGLSETSVVGSGRMPGLKGVVARRSVFGARRDIREAVEKPGKVATFLHRSSGADDTSVWLKLVGT